MWQGSAVVTPRAASDTGSPHIPRTPLSILPLHTVQVPSVVGASVRTCPSGFGRWLDERGDPCRQGQVVAQLNNGGVPPIFGLLSAELRTC